MIILLIETFSKKDDNLNNIDLLKQRFYKLIYITNDCYNKGCDDEDDDDNVNDDGCIQDEF